MKQSDPAVIALKQRVIIRRLLSDAIKTTSPQVRIEASVAACKVIATFLELIGHPKRPVAQTAHGLKPVLDLELPADLVNQAEESIPPDSEMPEAG